MTSRDKSSLRAARCEKAFGDGKVHRKSAVRGIVSEKNACGRQTTCTIDDLPGKEKGTVEMNTKKDNKVRKLTYSALFAAIVCIMTMIVKIPTPTKGYMNLGDAAVLTAGYMLGGVYGGAAAGIGSMLADLLSGYPIYAAATLVIKWLTAVTAAVTFKKLNFGFAQTVVCGVLGEAVMVFGYFVFEIFISGGAAAALTGIPLNLIQGAAGVAISSILYTVLKDKIHI